MDSVHTPLTLIAPFSIIFETFSPKAYSFDNFLRVLLPGWIFWIVFYFVYKKIPRKWTHPEARSTWAIFAPIFLLWSLIYFVVAYILHLYISIGKYENLFIAPFLPAMAVIAIFNNILDELKPVIKDIIYASIVFWFVTCVLFFQAQKLARKK